MPNCLRTYSAVESSEAPTAARMCSGLTTLPAPASLIASSMISLTFGVNLNSAVEARAARAGWIWATSLRRAG